LGKASSKELLENKIIADKHKAKYELSGGFGPLFSEYLPHLVGQVYVVEMVRGGLVQNVGVDWVEGTGGDRCAFCWVAFLAPTLLVAGPPEDGGVREIKQERYL